MANKITIELDKPVDESLIELVGILNKMRQAQKYFNEHYGYNNRSNKKRWEERADEWIANHVKYEE